ncbi:MAG: efflux RND transporter periplasmic adaptor subunit [Lentisphaerae bacterium]|nr:efflux RND transporter periplasmic adaptor subunit [Lentisphaerota bacterium]
MGDYRTTTGEPLPDTPRERRRFRRVLAQRLILGSIALILLGFAIPVTRRIGANGYVTTDHYAEVRPAMVGQVAEICIRSGQRVRQGDLLVRLDDAAEQASLEEARSNVHRLEADVVRRAAELDDLARRRKGELALSKLRFEHSGTTLALLEELSAKGLSSGRALADQRMAVAVAEMEWQSRLAEDATLADKELEVMQRELESKRSAMDRAEARLGSRHIYAPIGGEVVRYEFVIGEQVTPETVLYEVFGGEALVLKLRIPERHAARVQVGAAYAARLDSFRGWGDRRFRGRVEMMRAVIQSDNTRTYRMAYCTFEPGLHRVLPGTSAEARVTVGRSSLWAWLFGVY